MNKLKQFQTKLQIAAALMLNTVTFNGHAIATESYDLASCIVGLPVVEALNGSSSSFYREARHFIVFFFGGKLCKL